MSMVTKLVRVVTYWKELVATSSKTPSGGGLVRSRNKSNTLYIHLQKTHVHQTKRSTELL